MVVIYAEKEDMGKKIAAALDHITLSDGTVVNFSDLVKYEKKVAEQAKKDGYFQINFNGEPCCVTWGMGHLCGLKQAQDYNNDYKNWRNLPVPFIPARYEIKVAGADYMIARNERQLGIIKGLFDKADWLINSTDNDREGEVIFGYVYQYTGCRKPFKRALFSEQSQPAIKTAFGKLADSSTRTNIEAAGRARNIADWLVGSNLTAQLTLHNNSKDVLSVGRVQTATENILVKRELAIRNFKPEPYFTITAEFTASSGETYKAEHQNKRFDNKTDADKIYAEVNGRQGVIDAVDTKSGLIDIPELYNQSALQMECNDKFGLKMDETLSIAQALYEQGYTTYPRTSSRYLTEDMKDKIDYVLDQLETVPDYTSFISGRPRNFYTKRFFDDSKVKSHFAIIPTGVIPTGLDPKHQKVYDLICRSVIRMIYDPAKAELTRLITNVNSQLFISTGRVIIDKGWMVVTGVPNENNLPKLAKGDMVNGVYKEESKTTKPPQRYTDKTLLKAMISAGKDISDKELRNLLSDPQDGGIGTEATRAAIVKTLVDRGYAERKGKQFYATDKGIDLIQKLPVNDLKSAEITAVWEKRLGNIADGVESVNDFLNDINAAVTRWCAEINSSAVMTTAAASSTVGGTVLYCPVCGKPLNKFGWGWGCTGYKEGCKFSIGAICGKKISDTQVKALITNKITGEIKGFKSKKGKDFSAKLALNPDGTIGFVFPKT